MNIAEMAKNYTGSEDAKKELRVVQTQKCRMAKMKARKDYDEKMTEILQKEQMLKEVIKYFEPKKTFVTEMTIEDIQKLNFEETMKAIKSIQSKKCNSQYEVDQTEYEKACEIEKLLVEHKKTVKPVPENMIRKSELQNLVRHLENQTETVKTEYVIELLNKIMMNESEQDTNL